MRFLSPAVVLTALALPLVAQDPSPAERKRTIGIGVSLSPSALFIDEDVGFVPAGFGNFVIPIRMNPKLILEPEIGFTRFESSDSGGAGIPATSNSFSNRRLGVGILGDFGSQGSLKPYIGARVLRLTMTTEFQSGGPTTTVKTSGWTMAGVVGGQHFFSDVFSLGGEVQLARTSFGEPEVSGGGGGISGEKSTFFGTNGLITLRWFP